MAIITPKLEETPPDSSEIPVESKPPKKLKGTLPPLPCAKGGETTREKAFAWFDAIKEEDDRKSITIYAYRLFPKIIKDKSSGENLYIDKWKGLDEFSFNQFQALHGGGNYKFLITAIGFEHTIFYYKDEIDMNLFDPVINLKQLDFSSTVNKPWLDSQKNRGRIVQSKDGLVWKKDLDEENKKVSSADNASELLNSVTETLSKLQGMNSAKTDPALTALLTKLVDKPDDSFKVKDIAALITSLTPVITKLFEPKPQDNTMVTLLIEQAKSAREEAASARLQQMALIEKMMAAKPTDPIDSFMKMKELENMLKPDAPPEPEKKDRFEKFLDMFGAMAPALLGGMMGKTQMGMPSQNPQNQMPQYQPLPQQPQQPLPSQLNPSMLLQQFNDPSFSSILAGKINDELKGWEVAYELEDISGTGFYDAVTKFDKSVILSCILQSSIKPQLKPGITTTTLDEFVQDFIDYQKFDPESGLKKVVQ